MAEVTAAAAAVHFCARHPMTAIDGGAYRAFNGREEAWPASAALEFPVSDEERLAARRTGEGPGAVF